MRVLVKRSWVAEILVFINLISNLDIDSDLVSFSIEIIDLKFFMSQNT